MPRDLMFKDLCYDDLMNIALVTSRNFLNGYHDTEQLLNECKSKGHTASLQVWDSSLVDWSSFDIVFLHTPWDYTNNFYSGVKQSPASPV